MAMIPTGIAQCPRSIDFLERYAGVICAPVQTHTTVTSVSAADCGFVVTTDRGVWQCRTLVLATGACNVARVPAIAAAVPSGVATLTSMDYRNARST